MTTTATTLSGQAGKPGETVVVKKDGGFVSMGTVQGDGSVNTGIAVYRPK